MPEKVPQSFQGDDLRRLVEEISQLAVASENPDVLRATWLPREEQYETLAATAEYFDAALKQLPGATDAAALEVRLVRDADIPGASVMFEVQTSLALTRQVLSLVRSAQKRLAHKAGLTFEVAGTRKPYLVDVDTGKVLAAHGRNNVGVLHRRAMPLIHRYRLLAAAWRSAFAPPMQPVTIATVRNFVETLLKEQRADVRKPATGPPLDDGLLLRMGRALGYRQTAEGQFKRPPRGLTDATTNRAILGLVVDDVRKRGERRDTLLRKLRTLVGLQAAVLVDLTPEQVTALRRAFRKKSRPTPVRREKRQKKRRRVFPRAGRSVLRR